MVAFGEDLGWFGGYLWGAFLQNCDNFAFLSIPRSMALTKALVKALALDICFRFIAKIHSCFTSRGGLTEGHTMRRGIALAIALAAQHEKKALAKAMS
jgi:hypothetical protein